METEKPAEQISQRESPTIEGTETNYATPDSRRSHVRFTRSEYCRIFRTGLETGKSIQSLLREAYANGDLAKPRLNPDEGKAVLHAIKAIGAKLNRVTHRVNSGVTDCEDEITEVLNDFRTLISYLGLAHEKP
jgi:hypothetical protein